MKFAKVNLIAKNGGTSKSLVNLSKVNSIIEMKKSETISESCTMIDFGDEQALTYDTIDQILDSVITFK